MIKMERYKCEYCGTWHDTEEDAKKCEQRHLKPKKIEYIAYNDRMAQYPRYIGITNDEWRKTCSAEEFSEWITDKINAKIRMALHDAELYPDDINENEYMENKDEWVEWLKQPLRE